MNPNDRTKPAALTQGEKAKLGKIAQRVQSMPRGKWDGPSTYRPGLTLQLIGKLTEDLKYNEFATFKQWGAENPQAHDDEAEDPEDEYENEVELEYDEEIVFPWTIPNGQKITSGAKIIVAWMAGRWYLVGADRCPEDI